MEMRGRGAGGSGVGRIQQRRGRRGEGVPGCEGVGGDLREGKEFVAFDGAGLVLSVKLAAYPPHASMAQRTLSSFMNRFLNRSTSSLSTAHRG